MLGISKKVSFQAEELKAGDIISLQGRKVEWSRLYIFEVTKRLFRTVVLLEASGEWTPGDIYNFQIIDLDAPKWVKLV
jgi:hypothetical protein